MIPPPTPTPRSPSLPLQLRGFCANQKCVKITKEGERRSYGINEQRQRDIIQSPSLSPSHLSLCTHTPPLLLSAFVTSSSQFPRKLCFPFFLPFCLSAHASLCLFSPTNSLIIYFLSPISPLSFSLFPPSLSASPVLLQCQRSIRQLCSGWRGWRPGAVPLSECLSSPRPSVCPPSPMVLN